MKLNQLLAPLRSQNVQVTLVDLDTNTEIVTLQASGYESLDDAIENRVVSQWYIQSTTSIKVVLEPVTTTEP